MQNFVATVIPSSISSSSLSNAIFLSFATSYVKSCYMHEFLKEWHVIGNEAHLSLMLNIKFGSFR